jgi:hypothetical protein
MAGNANSGQRKDRLFRDAVIMELGSRDGKEAHKTLRRIAGAMIDAGIEGDIQAAKEIRDTIDGKPSQQIDIANPEGEEFKVKATIERIIIDPQQHSSNSDSAGIPAASKASEI